MIVEDYRCKRHVTTASEVENALQIRQDGEINSFWLSHEVGDYPKLAILVRENLACLHYFPNDGHAGFQSVAGDPGPDPYGTTVFFVRPTEKALVKNYAVVRFSDALKLAQEFAISPAMPKGIEWTEL